MAAKADKERSAREGKDAELTRMGAAMTNMAAEISRLRADLEQGAQGAAEEDDEQSLKKLLGDDDEHLLRAGEAKRLVARLRKPAAQKTPPAQRAIADFQRGGLDELSRVPGGEQIAKLANELNAKDATFQAFGYTPARVLYAANKHYEAEIAKVKAAHAKELKAQEKKIMARRAKLDGMPVGGGNRGGSGTGSGTSGGFRPQTAAEHALAGLVAKYGGAPRIEARRRT